jgi:hypothetical protein
MIAFQDDSNLQALNFNLSAVATAAAAAGAARWQLINTVGWPKAYIHAHVVLGAPLLLLLLLLLWKPTQRISSITSWCRHRTVLRRACAGCMQEQQLLLQRLPL